MAIASNGQVRRCSNPVVARKIWECLGTLGKEGKHPGIDNIVYELEKKGFGATFVVNELANCVRDDLLFTTQNESKQGFLKHTKTNFYSTPMLSGIPTRNMLVIVFL